MANDGVFGGILDAGINAAGSIMNWAQDPGLRAQAQAYLQQALANYQNIKDPALKQQAAQQIQSLAAQAGSDPALTAQQYAGQGQLQNIIDSGGMTLTDKANAQTAQNTAAQKAMATRQGLQNMLARQGVSPSATSAALQLGAAKNQQDTDSQASLQQAASAQQRAYQAILDRQKNAGAMQSQQFNQSFQKGQAADAIAKYNADARASAGKYNNSLLQQQYSNQMDQAGAQNGVLSQLAGQQNTNADRTEAATANTAGGLGKLASGVANAAGSQGTNIDGGADSYGQFASAPTQLGGTNTEEPQDGSDYGGY